jgi:hypothetical protein
VFVCIALRRQKTSIICFSLVLHLQIHKGRQQHTSYILQQILDLKRLRITDESNLSPLICDQEQLDISSSIHAPEKFDEHIDQHLQHSQDLSIDLQQMDDSLQELKADTLPFTFSQQEHLPSSSNIGLPLHGESFWQCKSPVQSSQV